jgi:hypothetical protein
VVVLFADLLLHMIATQIAEHKNAEGGERAMQFAEQPIQWMGQFTLASGRHEIESYAGYRKGEGADPQYVTGLFHGFFRASQDQGLYFTAGFDSSLAQKAGILT